MKKFDIEIGQILKCKVSCRLIGRNHIVLLPEEDNGTITFVKGERCEITDIFSDCGIYVNSMHVKRYVLYNEEIPQIFYVQPILSSKIQIL